METQLPDEVKLWRIGAEDALAEIPRSPLNLEARIQSWLARDISILNPDLLVIGREVETDFGGFIDLLCLDPDGDVVVVELKRDRTPRDIVAQVLDYGSWVADLTNERITGIAEAYLGQENFERAFRERFGVDVPETLNQHHGLMVVASQVDTSSERITRYLSDRYGVSINAATFQYFAGKDGGEYLARVFLMEPAQVEQKSHAGSKRRPNLTYQEAVSPARMNGRGPSRRHRRRDHTARGCAATRG